VSDRSKRFFPTAAEQDRLREYHARCGISRLSAALDLSPVTAEKLIRGDSVVKQTIDRMRRHLSNLKEERFIPATWLPPKRGSMPFTALSPETLADFRALVPYVSTVRLASYLEVTTNTVASIPSAYRPMRAVTAERVTDRLRRLLDGNRTRLRSLLLFPPNARVLDHLALGLIPPIPGLSREETVAILTTPAPTPPSLHIVR
jgi:DNA-binding transcriptional ArsR family regulator